MEPENNGNFNVLDYSFEELDALINKETDGIIENLTQNHLIFIRKMTEIKEKTDSFLNKFGFLLLKKMMNEMKNTYLKSKNQKIRDIKFYNALSEVMIIPLSKSDLPPKEDLEIKSKEEDTQNPKENPSQNSFDKTIKIIFSNKKYQFLPRKTIKNPLDFWRHLYKFTQVEKEEKNVLTEENVK